MTALAAALELAGQGIPVFPVHSVPEGLCTCGKATCEHPGKHPRYHPDDLRSGHKSASTDVDQIRLWFERWPDANVGAAVPTNYVILDIDPRNGGRESWERLSAAVSGIEPTLVAKTGGGGDHLWFRNTAEPVKCGSNVFGQDFPGIDLKTGGGYVVVPPSAHVSGGSYSWVVGTFNADLVTEFPAALRERLEVTSTTKSGKDRGGPVKGERQERLFKRACSLRGKGIPVDGAKANVLRLASECSPPFPASDAETIVDRVYATYPEGAEEEEETREKDKRKKSEKALALCDGVGLFHSPDKDAYGQYEVCGHTEVAKIRGRSFASWLNGAYFRSYGETLGQVQLDEVLGALEARANYEGPEVKVFTRIAHTDRKIYVDLGTPTWEVVEIDTHGWRILESSPVCFRRVNGMLPLAHPVNGGTIEVLRPIINADSDEDFALIAGYLVGAFMDPGCSTFPVLVLKGEKGSAKSTTARVLSRLIDPRKADIRRMGKMEDLSVTASKARILVLDNVGRLSPAWSDFICLLSTGGAIAKRELYTDDEEVILEAKLPVILTGIDEIVTASDLADRCLFPSLRRIDEADRKEEREFWGYFEESKPFILGWLLETVSHALRHLTATKPVMTPRMADFNRWVLAAESNFGSFKGRFEAAYLSSRQEADCSAFEDSVVAVTLQKLLTEMFGEEGSGTIDETAGSLHTKLVDSLPETEKRQFPKPNRLRGELRKAASLLRGMGIVVDEKAGRTAHRRPIVIHKLPRSGVTSVTPVIANVADAQDRDDLSLSGDDRNLLETAEVASRSNLSDVHDENDDTVGDWEDLETCAAEV